MMDINELSAELFGQKRLESSAVPHSVGSTNVTVAQGTATSESKNGSVNIQFDSAILGGEGFTENTPEMDPTKIEIPTTVDVREGDKVIISQFGNGTGGKTAVITGVIGSGDRTKNEIKVEESRAKKIEDKLNKQIVESMTNADRVMKELDEKFTNIKNEVDVFKNTADVTYATKKLVDERTKEVKETISALYLKKDDAKTTYAEKLEVNKKVDSLSATITSNYQTFTDYKKQNDSAVDDLQNGISNNKHELDEYKNNNDAAVSETRRIADETNTNLTKYKTDNDAEISTIKNEAEQARQALTNYKSATDNKLELLQNIADSAIETWTKHGVPTISNEPAVNWITPELKKQHQGDIYFDADTGRSYRWDGNKWVEIKNTDITKALGEIDNIKTNYITKSEIITTKEQLAARINETLIESKTYASNLVTDEIRERNAAIVAKANEISQTVSSTYTAKTVFEDYKNSTNSAMTDMDTKLTESKNDSIEAKTLANKAVSDSAKVQQNLNNYKTTVEQTYATQASLKTTNDSIHAEVTKRETLQNTVNDLETKLTRDYSSTTEMNAAIETKANEITQHVSTNYVTNNDAQATYAKKTELKLTDDKLTSSVQSIRNLEESVSTVSSTLTQTSSGLEFAMSKIDTMNKGLQDTYDSVKQLNTFIRFGVDQNGNASMRMGTNSSKVMMELTNEKMLFASKDTNTSLIELDSINKTARIPIMQIGRYLIVGNDTTLKIFYD